MITNQITANCSICNEVCSKDEKAKVIVCSETCRRAWYVRINQRKEVENAIKNNTLSKLGMTVRRLTQLGYNVSINKMENQS